MFSLTIAFGEGATMLWTLMWKEEASAKKAFALLAMPGLEQFEITDDFGQTCSVATKAVSGIMLEDMAQSKLAHIERALHQARMQQEGQEIAENDAVLRRGRMRAAGGPGVITPMGMGWNGGRQ